MASFLRNVARIKSSKDRVINEEHTLNPDNKQANRVALVTGAARRIGAGIATHLHQAGFRVVIHCHHSQKEAEKLAETMNRRCKDSATVLRADLMKMDAAVELVSKATSWGERLDLLVNNASVFTRSTLDEAEWDRLFTTNVKAPFWLSQAAYPHLAAHHGSIINITDIHAKKTLKDYSTYCQSKAALAMQTISLAREFAPCVRVNAVAPGATIWPELANELSEEIQQKIIARTPLKRHGHPKFIAQAVLALVENPFITGQTLSVDGGQEVG